MVQNKITNIIEEHRQRDSIPISFEVFPDGNLNVENFEYNSEYPSFFSVVWKCPPQLNLTNINKDNVDTIPAIELAKNVVDNGYTVLLHLTCIEMKKTTLKCILDRVKLCSIQNLLLLQGDGIKNNSSGDDGFSHVSEMISYIREQYEDHFCIGIAGFPLGHPNSQTLSKDLYYMKVKVEAGANFIITQMFYESEDFVNFVRNCRNAGINVPIIPGLCIFPSHSVLISMSELTQLPVPQQLLDEVESLEDDIDGFTVAMSNFNLKLIKKLFENRSMLSGIHWFTFNNPESIFEVLKNLSIFDNIEM